MTLFDSHTHLDAEQFGDKEGDGLAEVVARARAARVTEMVTCASDLESARQSIAIATAEPGVWAAVGVHPHEAKSMVAPPRDGDTWELNAAAFETLRELTESDVVVAIGEIGLDYHYDLSPRDVQRAVLRRQLALAQELALPVILHNRESDADLRAVVDESDAVGDAVGGVLHCFWSDRSLADWALERGFYLGVAGPITFRNAQDLVDVIRQVPLEQLLIETDCPYLAPHPRRGRRNEPGYVRYVAQKLAEIHGRPLDEIAEVTRANARRLFGLEGR